MTPSSSLPPRWGVPSPEFYVPPAELQVFFAHYDHVHTSQKIEEKVRPGLGKGILLEGADWRLYKGIERKLLGDHAVVETFRKQMGIEPEGASTKPHHWQFDLARYRVLIAAWSRKPDHQMSQEFVKLERYQQKLLLKAFEHFSKTTDPMRKGSPEGFSEHDLIVLHSLVHDDAPSYPKGDVKAASFRVFQQVYGVYKQGSLPTKLEEEDADAVEERLKEWPRELEKAISDDQRETILKHPFQAVSGVDGSKRREIYQKGKRIAGEVKNDFRRLARAYADLQVRMQRMRKEEDPKLKGDVVRYYETCRLAIVKAEALVNLYKPYLNDKNIAYLAAIALADLAELHAYEAETLSYIGLEGWKSSLVRKDPETVNEQAKLLLANAIQLAERAHLFGQPKSGILFSKLTRLQGGKALTESAYRRAKELVTQSVLAHPNNVEAQVEYFKLETAAWAAGLQKENPDTITDLLRLGKVGGDALREHFEAGSLEAGQALISLMQQRLKPESVWERFQRFVQQVINLFSFGSTSVAGEEPFFSKKPREFSDAEIDFLIKASLLELHEAQGLLTDALKAGFRSRIPLEQADSFLYFLSSRAEDPYMVVHGREAYRYLQFAAEMVLDSRMSQIDKQRFADETLSPYLEKMQKETFAYEVLWNLYNKLTEKPSAEEEVLTPFSSEEAPSSPSPLMEGETLFALITAASFLKGNDKPSPQDSPIKITEVSRSTVEKRGVSLPWLESDERDSPMEADEPELTLTRVTETGEPIQAVMTVGGEDILVEGDEERIRILAQVAEQLQQPTPERFLGALGTAAPLIGQLPFTKKEFAHLFQTFSLPYRGLHQLRFPGIAAMSLPRVERGEAAWIPSTTSASLLVEKFLQSNGASIAVPAALAALVALTIVVAKAGGGNAPIPREVAETLGQVFVEARGAVPSIARTLESARYWAAVARLGPELLRSRALQELMRRFPR